jgi:tRNA-specific adenosine deaminase 2
MLLRKFYVQENEKAPEPMDIHAPKSTMSPALSTLDKATSAVSLPKAGAAVPI